MLTSPLRDVGWETEEYILNCSLYYEKICATFGQRVIPFAEEIEAQQLQRELVAAYIKEWQPDILFVREHSGMPSDFWQSFRDKTLLVSMLGAPMPRNWHPLDWDMMFTGVPLFKAFFSAHGLPTYGHRNPFDTRLLTEVGDHIREYDVVFIGSVGEFWKERTRLIEQVACRYPLKWWGAGCETLEKDSPLRSCWQGMVGGIDMYTVYAKAKICLNDYVDVATGIAVNQRICEVMGMGSLMLTRASESLREALPADSYATFTDSESCVRQIETYLADESMRAEQAARGQQYVLNHSNHTEVSLKMGEIMEREWRNKCSKRRP